MTFALSFVVSVLISSCKTDPQVFNLNKYNNLINSYQLSVEIGAKLYLASNDNSELLRNLQLTIGSSFLTLDELTNGQPVKITSSVIIKSSNNEASSARLTGFLYATTAEQANDASFFVTVVNGPQNLSRVGVNTTTVVLNTQYETDWPPFDAPAKTTYVTGIEQLSNTNLNFHYDIPPNNYTKVTINQFFENPQFIPNFAKNGTLIEPTRAFFTSIEPLQINLPYWYITATGPYNMALDSKYMNEHVHNPTSENTTGVFVITDTMLEQSVNFTVDHSRKRIAGFLITTIRAIVSFYLTGGTQSILTQNYNTNLTMLHGQLVTENDGTQLVINSTTSQPGTFYCQYFMMSGDYYPLTTPTTTVKTTTEIPSTSSVWTTTKSVGSSEIMKFFSLFSILSTFLL